MAATPAPQPPLASPIAGSVLPIKRAEELLATLPGVVSVRIVASDTGAVDEIHVLTTAEVTPKQMVRNIESALIAHLSMRIDHRKISVATTNEVKPKLLEHEAKPSVAQSRPPAQPSPPEAEREQSSASAPRTGPFARRLYFEDVEVRGSRSKGLSCRVTLRKGNASYIGEALGIEGDRSRVELAARATLRAIGDADNREGQLGGAGAKVFDACARAGG